MPASFGIGFSIGCRGIPATSQTSVVCLTVVFTSGCRGILLQCLEHLLSFLQRPWCLQSSLSHLFFLTPLFLTAAVKCFYPFLNMLSHRCHQLGWGLSCVLQWVWQSCLHWLAGCGSSLSSLRLALQSPASTTCPRAHDASSYWFWTNNYISSPYRINSPEALNE